MNRPRLLLHALLALCLAGPLSAQTALTTLRVASGFSSPVYVTAPPGDHSRLFVVEQGGRIKIVRNGMVLPAPFLDISTLTFGSGERGLLGMAFHPDYANNGQFFVSYTRRSDGASILARYRVSSNPDVADPNSAQVFFGPVRQPFSNHNGGCIQFGPDGYLYFGLGDGGSAGDPACNAQRGNTLLGKMLRLDVDNAASRIPPTNPFVGNPAFLDEIWAIGLRNPWRFSFDRETGDLWIADVGQNAVEEVDFQPASSTGGENYGWKMMEGDRCFSTASCPAGVPPCNSPLLTMPVHTYSHSFGCSITGGYVYRGCAIPDLRGTYFFADFCSARVWSFEFDGTRTVNFRDRTVELRPSAGVLSSITSFGEDAAGEIYIVSRSGSIFKIVPNGPAPAIDLGFGGVSSGGLRPRFDVCGLLVPGSIAEFRLSGAPPSSIAALALSTSNRPTTFSFGTVVPFPVQIVGTVLVTDANGRIAFDVAGGIGPGSIVSQWGIADSGSPHFVVLSNALDVIWQ